MQTMQCMASACGAVPLLSLFAPGFVTHCNPGEYQTALAPEARLKSARSASVREHQCCSQALAIVLVLGETNVGAVGINEKATCIIKHNAA